MPELRHTGKSVIDMNVTIELSTIVIDRLKINSLCKHVTVYDIEITFW